MADRKDRLRRDYRQKAFLRTSLPALKLRYSNSSSIRAQDLFETRPGRYKSNVDLISPFLVPLIIETLQKSVFADRTEIVPGEADAWCAAFARKYSATILTNDSDLAVYDLENGQVIFLDSLRRRICDKCATPCILADVLQSIKLAKALGASDIKHAAFSLFRSQNDQKGSTTTQAKRRLQNHNPSASPSADDFNEFCKRYPEVDLEQDLDFRTKIQHLDPRLSEVVEQLRRPADRHITSILPSLVDDHSKKSAWLVSGSIRDFSYSLLWHIASSKDTSMFEYLEKGQPPGHGRRISLLDKGECDAACGRLLDFLQVLRTSSDESYNIVSYWRTVCMVHVCYWCIATDLSSVEELRSHVSAAWNNLHSGLGLSWSEIHFRGQLEATYYAFRQLRQVLKLLELLDKLDEVGDISALHQMMTDLPGILEMLEDHESETKQIVDIDHVIMTAQEMLED